MTHSYGCYGIAMHRYAQVGIAMDRYAQVGIALDRIAQVCTGRHSLVTAWEGMLGNA